LDVQKAKREIKKAKERWTQADNSARRGDAPRITGKEETPSKIAKEISGGKLGP